MSKSPFKFVLLKFAFWEWLRVIIQHTKRKVVIGSSKIITLTTISSVRLSFWRCLFWQPTKPKVVKKSSTFWLSMLTTYTTILVDNHKVVLLTTHLKTLWQPCILCEGHFFFKLFISINEWTVTYLFKVWCKL